MRQLYLIHKNELQKAVEAAALSGAANFEITQDPLSSGQFEINTSKVQTTIQDTFNKIVSINSFISGATFPSITLNPTSKAVMVTSSLNVNTYFIKLLGIYYVTVQAQAAAMSAPFYLSPDFQKD